MITEELSRHAWHPGLQSERAGARMWQNLVGFWLLEKGGCWIQELDFMWKKERDAPGLVQIPSPVQGCSSCVWWVVVVVDC